MDLFVCDKCNSVDAIDFAYPDGLLSKDGTPPTKYICTKCQTGEWHDFFDKEVYRPDFDVVVNRPTSIGLG